MVGRLGRLDKADLFEIVLVDFQHLVHTAKEEKMVVPAKEVGTVGSVGIVDMAADMVADMVDFVDIAEGVVETAHIVGIVVEGVEAEAVHMVDYTDCIVVAAAAAGVWDVHMTEDAEM